PPAHGGKTGHGAPGPTVRERFGRAARFGASRRGDTSRCHPAAPGLTALPFPPGASLVPPKRVSAKADPRSAPGGVGHTVFSQKAHQRRPFSFAIAESASWSAASKVFARCSSI